MKKATPESKDILNPTETIEYFGLSRRKFYSLLSEKKNFVHGFRVTDDEGTLVQWGHYDGI